MPNDPNDRTQPPIMQSFPDLLDQRFSGTEERISQIQDSVRCRPQLSFRLGQGALRPLPPTLQRDIGWPFSCEIFFCDHFIDHIFDESRLVMFVLDTAVRKEPVRSLAAFFGALPALDLHSFFCSVSLLPDPADPPLLPEPPGALRTARLLVAVDYINTILGVVNFFIV